jgi:hypothetical protein
MPQHDDAEAGRPEPGARDDDAAAPEEERLRAKYLAPGAPDWKPVVSERLARALAGRYSETRDPREAGEPSAPDAAPDAAIEALLEEMIVRQRAKVLAVARRIEPTATFDDTLQPHDNPRIHANALFQFEDGLLAGLLAAQAAIRARRGERREGR